MKFTKARATKMGKLEEYMAYGWEPVLERHPEGGYRLTVQHLDDFELFGPKKQLLAEWKDALRGHLRAYLKHQKRIPIPTMTVSASQPRTFDAPKKGQIFVMTEGLTVAKEVEFV